MRERNGVFRTGWCGITMHPDKNSKTGYTEVSAPESSHRRCSGQANAGGGKTIECRCECHR